MSSNFKEENKLPEEDEDYGDEEGDQIQDLQSSDGVGSFNQHAAPMMDEMPEEESPLGKHHYPSAKPLSGMKSTGVNAKYDPASWDQFYDTTEMLDGVIPIYYAGSKGHVFLCLHGAGHSAQSFAVLAKLMKA